MMSQRIWFLVVFSCFIVSVYGRNYVNITNCPSEYEHAKFFPTQTLIIMPEWLSQNKDMVYNYNWKYEATYKSHNKLYTLNTTKYLEYMKNNTYKLVIPKGILTPKKYLIKVSAKRKPKVKTGPVNALENGTISCKIEVYGFRPVVIISGGLRRLEPSGRDILVNGDESYDRVNKENKTLRFTWNCAQKKQPPTFCNNRPISTESRFTIPGELVEADDEFTIFLNARLIYGQELINDNATQTITIGSDSTKLTIGCKKNCPPITDFPNYKKLTFIEVSCVESCEHVKPEYYEWEIFSEVSKDFTFDYKKSRLGRNGPRFIIEKDALKAGEYIVSVTLKINNETRGFAAINLVYVKPADVKDCKIKPEQGDSLKTYFRFSCQQEPADEANFYELYFASETDPSKEQLIMDGVYPEVQNRSFHLPPSQGNIYFVRVIKEDHPDIDLQMKAEVTSGMENKSAQEVVKILDGMYNGATAQESITKLVASKDPDDRHKALQIFQAMVNELVISKIDDPEYADFVNNLKYQAAEDMLKAPANSINEVFKISESLTKLHAHNASLKSDPLLAKFTTTVCRKMADRALGMMKQEKYPYDMAEKSKKLAGTMSKCLGSHAEPNYDVLTEDKHNITTETPVFDQPVLTENYPDYVDHDDTYYKNLDNLKEASYNSIKTSATAAKITAMTTATGEGLIKLDGKLEETLIFKDTGKEVAKQEFEAQGVRLRPSQDFAGDDHSYDVLMTTWKKDILWWNPGSTKIATNLANVEFWHSTCKLKVNKFKQPANIFFHLKNESDFDVDIHRYSLKLPQGYASMNDSELNYQIKVHRISLPKTRMLQVKFFNLSSTDSFNVVIIENKFPTTEDFTSYHTVQAGSNYSMKLFNKHDYDILAYVGILVNKKTAKEGATINYVVGSFVSTCIRWLSNDSRWIPTCKPGEETTDLVIHCQCNHFSVTAGYMENIKSPQQEVMKPDLELKLLSSWIVFVTVMVTFAIYTLLLLVLLVKKQEEIYFLSDNLSYHRYAYLIMIRTGIGFRSGTTSNVTIKIFGDKDVSEPHVLNYPDPKLRLLQMFGHDTFLLTTQDHLGEIRSIELWLDSIGRNPSWECRHITVYDMQERTQWHFDVKQSLSVIKDTTHIAVTPTTREISNEILVAKQDETPEVDASGDKPTTKTKFRIFKSVSFKKSDAKEDTKSTKDKKGKFKFSSFKPSSFKFDKFDCSKVKKFLAKLQLDFTYIFTTYYRNHTWFLGRTEQHFSYFKKVTVVFSTILTTLTTALMLHGTPSLQLKDVLDEHLHYRINVYAIFVGFASSFLAFPPHVAISWCFRYSQIQFSRYDQSTKLPFIYTIVCWSVLISLITFSSTFLTVFGFWLPQNSSWIWLTSCFISIIFGFLFYEAMFMYIQDFFLKLQIIADIGKKFTDIYLIIEHQRRYLYTIFGHQLLRPYFDHLYIPLSRKQIRDKRGILERRYYVISELEDLIMFGIYVIILYIVILANKDNMVVKGKTAMEEMMEGIFTRTFDFEDIDTPRDIYDYINVTLIPSIQPHRWYGKYVMAEPGLMKDMVTKYIGVARLRQHRTKSDVCKVPKLMEFLNMTCFPEYSIGYTETRQFGYYWGAFSSFITFDRLRQIWEYAPQSKTATLGIVGEFATYSGGGYVAYLGRTLYNSYANFRKLLEKLWINAETRVVFIEFLTYNANYNIFNAVQLSFEQSATGFMYNKIFVYAARMLFVHNEVQSITYMFFFLFVAWVSMLLLKQTVVVKNNLRTFYKDAWLMVDITIIFLSLVCVILFGVRMTFIGKYLDALENAKHNEFLSYFYLFYIEDFITFVAAVLVCMATLRLWKFLRFAITFRVLERTLVIAIPTIMSFTLIVVLILTSTGLAVVLSIGNYFERIYSLIRITRLLSLMPLRATELQIREFISYKSVISYLIFAGIVLKISVFIYIMIIVMAYAEAQLDFSSYPESYTIKNYVQETMRYIPTFVKYKFKRLKAGFGETVKVEPKSDKFLYLNSFSVQTDKMNLMKYVTKTFIRNKNRPRKKTKLSKYDAELMLELCRFTVFRDKTSQEVDVFYKGRVRGSRIKFVDERRIEKIANCVNFMLQEQPPDAYLERHTSSSSEKYSKMIKKNQMTLKKCSLSLKLVLQKMRDAAHRISSLR